MELSGVYGELGGREQHIANGLVVINILDLVHHLVELHILMYGKLDQELIVQQVVLTQFLTTHLLIEQFYLTCIIIVVLVLGVFTIRELLVVNIILGEIQVML